MTVKTNINFFITIAGSEFNARDVLHFCAELEEKQAEGRKYISDLAIPEQYTAIADALETEGILTRTEEHDLYRAIEDTKLLTFIQDLTKAMNEKTQLVKPIMEGNVTSATANVIELLYWKQDDLKQGFFSKDYVRYLVSDRTMKRPNPITDNLVDAEIRDTFSREYVRMASSCDSRIQSATIREVLKTEGIILKSWA